VDCCLVSILMRLGCILRILRICHGHVSLVSYSLLPLDWHMSRLKRDSGRTVLNFHSPNQGQKYAYQACACVSCSTINRSSKASSEMGQAPRRTDR